MKGPLAGITPRLQKSLVEHGPRALELYEKAGSMSFFLRFEGKLQSCFCPWYVSKSILATSMVVGKRIAASLKQ